MRWLPLAALALLACSPETSESPRYNVLLLSADSLRTDRLALWNPADGVETPHLEALARRGALYRNTWAVTPWTAPSMVSVFTGLYPPSHGVVFRDDTTSPGLPTLANLLGDAGYRLGNFTFFSGISYFRNLGLPPATPGLAHGRETEAFLAWLDDAGSEPDASDPPFFAWIHLLEPHLPYGASGYRATEVQIHGSSGLEASQLQATLPIGSADFEEGDRDRLIELYDQDIERLDRQVGIVLDGLRERGLEDRTVVVFVADHGEELLDDGWVGHASTAVLAKLRAPLLQIPMILAGPGIEPAGEHTATVQQVDVLPTVLGLLGLDLPEPLDGRVLPGVEPLREPRAGFLSTLRRLFDDEPPSRSFAFFDTSLGGNLTPIERVGERLQGVSDGACLLESHVESEAAAVSAADSVLVPLSEDGPDCEARRDDLETELARWRREQAEHRFEIVRSQPTGGAPGPEAAAYDETLRVGRPGDGQRLEWRAHGGQIALEWEGEAPSFWIEYRVGRFPTLVEGSFQVESSRLLLGPFPEGFWNDIAGYSPFRFRVLDSETRRRSPWVTFEVAPASSRSP